MAIAIAMAIVVLLVGISFWSPYVLTWGNLANIAQAAAPLILMSLGVFLVIATSGIDLSVGSTFSLTGMVAGLCFSAALPWPVVCLISLGVGLAVGAINGGLVTVVGLAPFVVTLITLIAGQADLTPEIHPFSRSTTTLPAVGTFTESSASALQFHFAFAYLPSSAPERWPAWKLSAP